MKQKKLEMLLQKVPAFEYPSPNLEQYITPANIAADILFNAYSFGDIENKTVLDLGCGTGIFSVGASLIGAKKVIAVDIDKNAVSIAKNYAQENKLDIEFLVQNIDDVKVKCDTVIMNPPFGAQKSNEKADRNFIEKAFEISSIIYSLHLSKTIPFMIKIVKALNGKINYSKDYIFPIRHIYDFHEKNVVNYDVTILRILTKF